MAKFNIEEVIKSSTLEDGTLDTKKLMGIIDNDYVNPIVAKQKPDLEKLKTEAKDEWITNLGFENVTNEAQLKSYVKSTSNEWQEKYNDLKKDFDSLETSSNELKTNYETVNSKMTSYERQSLLTKDNFNGDAEYALYKINQNVNDDKDFETAYAEYKEENKQLFAPNKVPNVGTKVIHKNGESKYGFESILEEKGKI